MTDELMTDELIIDLHSAVQYRYNIECVRLSLTRNVTDIEEYDYYGYTALFYAVSRGDPDIIILLLDNGANIEARDQREKKTPLMCAVIKGDIDIIRLLIEKGADLEACDKEGWSVFDHALECPLCKP